MELAESKMPERPFYQPGASSVEGLPLALQMFHNRPLVMLKPHWHAQVEVNFIVRGSVHYRMNEHEISLSAGDMCLFWGGLPHQMDDASDDAVYAGAHLPLVHFFRLHLPADVRHRLMTGATLVTSATDASDDHNFERWNRYARSGDPAKAAARRQRTAAAAGAGAVRALPAGARSARPSEDVASPFDQQSSRNVGRMCDFIAENFLYDIDCVDIAAAADIHPKYAMSVFKKSTGMTLNEYVNLLRLSYAQALLMHEDANVLQRRHGQRLRLAQRLQQIVPQASSFHP